MNIFLLGEFSGLFSTLRDGLRELGHDVILASSGDGYKGFDSDIRIETLKPNSTLLQKLKYIGKMHSLNHRIKKYDIVQLCYDHIFAVRRYNSYAISCLKNNNKKIFLTLAGSNSTVMRYWLARENTKAFVMYNDAIKYDDYKAMLNDKLYEYEKKLASEVNGLLPVMYEYYKPYEKHVNIRSIIPLPVDLKKINYCDNKINNKVVFFHGLNRYGFKGTCYIEEAFKIIKGKYPNDVEVIIAGKLKNNEYVELLRKVNIVLDQTSSYSLGINGLLSLALGKVVMGGAEREGMDALGYENCPVYNLKPDINFIVSQMEQILANKKKIMGIGYDSRKFVEQFHDHLKVAEKYIAIWSQ